jgi:hypothetical protein
MTATRKHPSKTVDTVTSNDENVRLRIYDGVIPLGDAGDELLQMALANNRRLAEQNKVMHNLLGLIERQQRKALVPWPVRWWRYIRDASRRNAG